MPRRKEHVKLRMEEIPFPTKKRGERIGRMSAWKDEPSQKYPGLRHRDYRHDPIKTAKRFSGGSARAFFGEKLGDAWSHVEQDGRQTFKKKIKKMFG